MCVCVCVCVCACVRVCVCRRFRMCMSVCEWSSYHVKLETEDNVDLLPHMKRGINSMSPDFYMRVCVYKQAHFFPVVGLAPTNSSILFTSLNSKMATASCCPLSTLSFSSIITKDLAITAV